MLKTLIAMLERSASPLRCGMFLALAWIGCSGGGPSRMAPTQDLGASLPDGAGFGSGDGGASQPSCPPETIRFPLPAVRDVPRFRQ